MALPKMVYVLLGGIGMLALSGCTTVIRDRYEATALTRYTWLVEYGVDPTGGRNRRFEEFASTSLLNRNGEKPTGAVTGPDDRGLWWGALPPRPTVDDLEARQKPLERIGTPQLIKKVDYHVQFEYRGEQVKLPTNYDVYRQVVLALRVPAPLQFTLGPGDRSVENAELAD